MMTGWLHISGHDLWSDPCASTARPRSSTASVERPPASEISYIARIRCRWEGRVAKKWQNMTREGRVWCPPKMTTSWYEQPLMRLQLNTKLTCINLSSSFPLIHWNSWASHFQGSKHSFFHWYGVVYPSLFVKKFLMSRGKCPRNSLTTLLLWKVGYQYRRYWEWRQGFLSPWTA